MSAFTTLSTTLANTTTQIRNYFSPGSVGDYPSFVIAEGDDETAMTAKAKAAYQSLIHPDTGEIDPSDIKAQLQATQYLLTYLNWILANSPDEEKKKRALSLKMHLATVYQQKKWMNRLAEMFSWLYGLMQGAAIAGYFILIFGISAVAGFEFLSGSFAILLGAAGFLGIVGLCNYFIIKRDMPRLLLRAFNRWDEDSHSVPKQSKIQAAIAFLMAIVAAMLWFGLCFYGSYELFGAINEAIYGKEAVGLGALVWIVPLTLSAAMIFLPELALNFEGNKDFLKDWQVNRQNGKGWIASLGPTAKFWADLKQEYQLNDEQLAKVKANFLWNAGCAMVGMLGTALVGATAMKSLFGGGMAGAALSGFVIVMGTLCQIAFYRSRAKDLAVNDAREMLASTATADKSSTPNAQPHSNAVNSLRFFNALGAVLPAAIGTYKLGGIDMLKSPSGLDALGAFGVAMAMLSFAYLAFKGSWTASSQGAQNMWEVRSMAEEVQKPVAGDKEIAVRQNKGTYTPGWNTWVGTAGFTPDCGRNYETPAHFEREINFVAKGSARPAA